MERKFRQTAFALAATALFAACSESDLITAIVEEEIPIGFNTGFVDNVTKAEMKNKESLNADGNTFMVWGWKTFNTTETKVFNGTTVTYDSNYNNNSPGTTTTNWKYSPLKYWDRTASYMFYAVSPANSSVFSIDASTKKISATIPKAIQALYTDGATANASSSTAVDYLVANNVSCAAGKATQGNAGDKDVEFTFNHILSKFNVKVKTTTEFTSNPKIKLKGLDVYVGGLCKTYSQATAGSVSTSDTWSEPANAAYTTAPDASATADMTCFNKTGDERLSLTATAQDVASYLVCPTATASTAGNKVFVKATYDLVYSNNETEPFETEITEVQRLKSGSTTEFEPALPKFQQGFSYDLTVTIAPSAIYFDVESVSSFTTGTGADITVE